MNALYAPFDVFWEFGMAVSFVATARVLIRIETAEKSIQKALEKSIEERGAQRLMRSAVTRGDLTKIHTKIEQL